MKKILFVIPLLITSIMAEEKDPFMDALYKYKPFRESGENSQKILKKDSDDFSEIEKKANELSRQFNASLKSSQNSIDTYKTKLDFYIYILKDYESSIAKSVIIGNNVLYSSINGVETFYMNENELRQAVNTLNGYYQERLKIKKDLTLATEVLKSDNTFLIQSTANKLENKITNLAKNNNNRSYVNNNNIGNSRNNSMIVLENGQSVENGFKVEISNKKQIKIYYE